MPRKTRVHDMGRGPGNPSTFFMKNWRISERTVPDDPQVLLSRRSRVRQGRERLGGLLEDSLGQARSIFLHSLIFCQPTNQSVFSRSMTSFLDFPLPRALDSANNGYGLTITLPSSYWYLQHFDMVNLAKSVDWFNMMTYDIHAVVSHSARPWL